MHSQMPSLYLLSSPSQIYNRKRVLWSVNLKIKNVSLLIPVDWTNSSPPRGDGLTGEIKPQLTFQHMKTQFFIPLLRNEPLIVHKAPHLRTKENRRDRVERERDVT